MSIEISPPAGKTELLFFEPRPTQVQILNQSWVEVRPMQALTSGPITFRIPASSEAVIDLSRTFLYLRCRIVLSSGAKTVFSKPTQGEVDRLTIESTRLTTASNNAAAALITAQTTTGTRLIAYNNKSAAFLDAQEAEPPVIANVTRTRLEADTAAQSLADAQAAERIAMENANNALLQANEARDKTTQADNLRTGLMNVNLRVAPVANTLHSLFSAVDLTINNRSITTSSGNYPYKAYLARLLSSSRDAIDSQFQSAMFYPDKPGEFDGTAEVFDNATNADAGIIYRKKLTQGSTEFELMDTLFLDLANQEKLLLPGLNVVLTLHRSDPKFVLMSAEKNIDYKIEIVEATLMVRSVEVAPGFLLETEKRLQHETAKYYFQRLEVHTIPLNVKQTVVNESNLTLAAPALPNRLILAMVETESQGGNYAKNPFKFELLDLQSIKFFFNGQGLPYRTMPFMLRGNNQIYLQGYYSLFSQTGLHGHPYGSSWISRENWLKGYAIQCFEFAPDGIVGDHLQLSRGGVLNLEMRFNTPLEKSISIVMLACYDSYLQITADRSIIANFTIT